MQELKEKHCLTLEQGTVPMSEKEQAKFKNQLHTPWDIIDNRKLRKVFPFENFKRGMAFAQEVALLAEIENHHPDICIHFSSVEVELSTHDIGGLSENDFIMAAKFENI